MSIRNEVINNLEIDFDKLLNDFLERYNEKNPNPGNNAFVALNARTAKTAAQVCASILRDYEKLKRTQDP